MVFEQYKQAINQSLAAYFERLPKRFGDYDLPEVARYALQLVKEYTMRPGKRVRGALAAMAYDDIAGKKLSQNGQTLAIVMELVQSYLLIVDDVTDKSDLRRGEPTVHRMYERRGNIGLRDAEQLAFYTGMVTGHLANLVLLDIDEPAENLVQALRFIQENIVITGFGQLDDITQEISRKASTADIIRKYALKTSHYTFINPLQAGMALAGVTDSRAYQQVAEFGVAAGIAFQAHDDYLGVFGGVETGKSSVDDIKEGKLTLLVQYAIEHGSEESAQRLSSYLGNPHVREADMDDVRAILNETGATIEAQQTAQNYADQALRQLSAITPLSDTFKAQLAELVRYSISRKS
jgi:geranylgeranyl diphosphate synthase type I